MMSAASGLAEPCLRESKPLVGEEKAMSKVKVKVQWDAKGENNSHPLTINILPSH